MIGLRFSHKDPTELRPGDVPQGIKSEISLNQVCQIHPMPWARSESQDSLWSRSQLRHRAAAAGLKGLMVAAVGLTGLVSIVAVAAVEPVAVGQAPARQTAAWHGSHGGSSGCRASGVV